MKLKDFVYIPTYNFSCLVLGTCKFPGGYNRDVLFNEIERLTSLVQWIAKISRYYYFLKWERVGMWCKLIYFKARIAEQIADIKVLIINAFVLIFY